MHFESQDLVLKEMKDRIRELTDLYIKYEDKEDPRLQEEYRKSITKAPKRNWY